MKKAIFTLTILMMAFGNVSLAQRNTYYLKSDATANVLKHYNVRDETTVVPQIAQWQDTYGDKYRTTYTYDEYDYYLVEEMTEMDYGDGWHFDTRSLYEYDFSGNVLEKLTQMWDGYDWYNITNASYSYVDDLVSEVVYQLYTDDSWMNYEKEVYTYNGDVTTILFWNWNGSNWSSNELYTYTDDGMGTIELLIQYMQGGAWQNFKRITYTLEFIGNVLEILYEDWENGVWVNKQLTVYDYFDEVYDSMLVGYWENGDWLEKFRYEFDYEGGNAVHGVCDQKEGDQWIPCDGEIEMAYDYSRAVKIFYGHEVNMSYVDLTSVNENNQTTNFKVYPIPADGEVFIQSDNFQKAEIYSITGQKLKESRMKKLNVEALDSGVYLLKVYTKEGESQMQKVMVK